MKALININGRNVSPLNIKGITKTKGGRWGHTLDGKRLYHPLIEVYLRRLPWYQRWWVGGNYPSSWHYRSPTVEIDISGRYYDVRRISFSNRAKCDAFYDKVMTQWDDGLAKFHGTDADLDSTE